MDLLTLSSALFLNPMESSMSRSNLKSELKHVYEEINVLLEDLDSLAAAIESDPNFRPYEKASTQNTNIDELIKKDAELSGQLSVLTSLKVVSAFIDEFKTNYDLWELENCYYSLQNMHKKLETIDLSNLSLRFQESLSTYIDSLHADLVDRIKDLLGKFWSIDRHKIQYINNVRMGEDEIEFEFEGFKVFLETCFYSDGHFDPNSWFTSEIRMGDTRDEVSNALSEIYTEYITYSKIITILKESLFSSDVQLVLCEDVLLFQHAKCQTEQVIASFENLAYFLLHISPKSCSSLILSQLGNTFVNEIVKFVKLRSNEVLTPDSSSKLELIKLNQMLVDLSEKVNTSWKYHETRLTSLLYDEHILNNLLLDKLLRNQVVELRSVFSDDSWKDVSIVQLKERSNCDQTVPAAKKKNMSGTDNPGDEDDEWRWHDEDDEDANGDGWEDEIDFNIDTNDSESAVNKEIEEEDPWESAWQDETLKLDKDVNSIHITRVPHLFETILGQFEAGCDQIGREKIASSYQYKLNVLLTSFMAMCMSKYEEWWQLYKDISYLTRNYSIRCDLFRLNELMEHYVGTHVKNMKKVAQNMVHQQLKNLQVNEKNPDWGITIESLLPYIKNVAYPAFTQLEDEKKLTAFITFLYNDCIVRQILAWKMISERNSENLAEFIKLVLSGTDRPTSNQNIGYQREKLSIIGRVLTSHLTEIMDMFSNGDFYLFTTEEIIQWITMLFADTGLRKECIEEIRTVRLESAI